MKKLILIDGNAIVHRAFHAMPPFKTSAGELVNAVYGFASMLLNILNNEKPTHIAVSFDMKGKTFRHTEYADYKGTRQKAPDGLYEQFPRIKDLVRTFDIPIYEMEGFEADDVLGTLAAQAEEEGDIETFIVTGDKDAFQLITETTKVITPHKGFSESIIYDTAKVQEKFGLNPSQIADMKGLEGDSSDNIKGVPGIGPKSARPLLQKYGTLEGIYKHIDEISGSAGKKLKEYEENAFFSRRMATIIKDVPMKLVLQDCVTHEFDDKKLFQLFEELEFLSLLGKLGRFNRHSEAKQQEEVQQSLF